MKKLIAASFALCFTVLCFAQENTYLSAADSDPEAKAVLDKIKAKYESFKTLQASFTLTIEFDGEVQETQEGEIIQKGDKYHLDFESQTVISDGSTVWYHLKNNNEVQINNAEDLEEEGSLSPNSLLRIYEQDDYVYALSGDQKENGHTVQYIDFKPTDKDSEYFKLRLAVDKKTNEIKRIKAFSKDGSRYTLEIQTLKGNGQIDESYFSFDKTKFPGIHVEDLRIP